MSRTIHPAITTKVRKPGRKVRRQHHHQMRQKMRHEIMLERLGVEYERIVEVAS